MRTNIDIDDELMREAMKATGTTTKRAAIQACLQRLVALHEWEQAVARDFRKQEKARRAAERAGKLDEWHAQLVKNGNLAGRLDDAHKR